MGVIKCPECGHQTSEKASICPSCGVEIAGKVVKCANCGEVFFKDDGLCPHCYRPYQFQDQIEPEKDEELPTQSAEVNDADEATSIITEDNTPSAEDTHVLNTHPYTKPFITIVPQASDAEETSMPNEDKDPTEEEEEVEMPLSDKKETKKPDENDDEEEEEEEDHFIDTDSEQLERPVTEVSEDDENNQKSPKRYIPVVVSIAITALIAAVCLYFYNDSKSIRELQAFNSAMENDDIDELNTFLRDFTDASSDHKQKVKEEIARLNKQEQDLSLVKVTRDKNQLLQFLKDYPGTSMKKEILATIDSLDWEDAMKTNTKAAYDKYIAEHSQGIFINEAKERVAVKEVTATEEDTNMARSLFREFFLSVNGNDAARLTNTLNGDITKFMGTEKPSSNEVVSWMKKQHGENVSNVIWKLNNDYRINKREQNGVQNYAIDFTAKQTIIHKDGRSTTENYKITAEVTEKRKISSMTMSKYTPKPGEVANSTNNASANNAASPSKPASSNTSSNPSTPSKPASSNTSSKPSTPSKPASSNTSSKASTPSKPASSNTTSKPSTPSKPASSNTSSKPSTPSKPASSNTSSKPSTQSKPASSNTSSKPSTQSKPSGNSSGKTSSGQGNKK